LTQNGHTIHSTLLCVKWGGGITLQLVGMIRVTPDLNPAALQGYYVRQGMDGKR
jgi:hypothetical protein